MSATMNLSLAPETMILHRALWAGRIMSAFVVIARWRTALFNFSRRRRSRACCRKPGSRWTDPCRGSDHTRLGHPLRYPGHRRPSGILVTGFLGAAICAHVRIGELGSPPEIISLLLGAMTWGGLYARDPHIRAILPLIR